MDGIGSTIDRKPLILGHLEICKKVSWPSPRKKCHVKLDFKGIFGQLAGLNIFPFQSERLTIL